MTPTITTDTSGVMRSLALLKGIPLAKVVRNAARDFAQAARRATPVASKSRSEYYRVRDRRTGEWRYLHVSMLEGRSRKSLRNLRKVRIYKGWSRASWIGVFRALGMGTSRPPARLPSRVEAISDAMATETRDTASAIIEDYIRFDAFGRGSDSRSAEIAQAGFALAAQRMARALNAEMGKRWEGR